MKKINQLVTASAAIILASCGGGSGGSGGSNASSIDSTKTFYFAGVADSGNDYGIELYKTDGSEEGTELVKDINTTATPSGGTEDAVPYQLATAGDGKAIFATSFADGVTGRGTLWQTDGSENGTELLVDHGAGMVLARAALPAGVNTYATPLAVIGDKVIYSGRDQSNSLYVYDAVDDSYTEHVNELGNMDIGASVFDGDYLYFLAKANDADRQADRLYKTNGETLTTLESFSAADNISVDHLEKIGERLFYIGEYSGDAAGYEVWQHDMSAAGQIKRSVAYDISAGAADTSIMKIMAIADKLFIIAQESGGAAVAPHALDFSQDPVAYQKLKTTNFTTGYADHYRPVISYNGSVYFTLYGGNNTNGANTGTVSWFVSDGITSNTYAVNLNGGLPAGFIAPVKYLGQVNGKMIIKGVDNMLYASDGTGKGTVKLQDNFDNDVRVYSSLNDQYASGQRLLQEKPSFFVSNGQLIFIGGTYSNQTPRLYKTNGSSVSLVKDGITISQNM